jgi:predicted enzyme related to lactoylglutathione lyase
MKPLLGLRSAFYAAPDLALAKRWYIEATGIEPYFDQPFYVGFEIGGYELGLIPDGAPSSGSAYWGVKEIEAAFERLLSLGATVVEAPRDVGGGIRTAAVRDPFGNVLGIIENPSAGR